MSIAITAVSGHLGAEIAKALIALNSGANILGLARSPENAEDLGIEVRPGDYDDLRQLTQSLSGVDTLVLISGMAPPDERVGQHRNVLNAARSAGVSKIVYTSIQGAEEGTDFSPVVQSNRQAEADIRVSGMDWAIGRNGIYIEPDVEYIERYKERGAISNCAGDAKCGYTTRPELAYAYAQMAIAPSHNGQSYNLHGEPITQVQLADYLNEAFGTQLTYQPMSISDYRKERIDELGEFLGTVIAGIYEGIRMGANDNHSDFEAAAGRQHQDWGEYFRSIGQ